MSILYDRIQGVLDKKNISGYRLCKDLGMSRTFMTALKNGKTKGATDSTVSKIANYLEVSSDYLLGNTDDPTPPGAKKEPPATVPIDQLRELLEELLGAPISEEEAESFLHAYKTLKFGGKPE